MAAKKVTKPRVKWLKSCNDEPFAIECVEGFLGRKPLVFVGDYGFRKEREIQKFIAALERVNEWLAAERKKK